MFSTSVMLLALVVVFAAPLLIGYGVLRPVTRAVKSSSRPTQFQLTDFVWLILQLQIVLAAVVGYVPRRETTPLTIILGFGAISTIAIWWGAIRTMLKAGVRGAVRRGVFVLFLLPAVLFLMIGGTIFLIAVPIILSQSFETQPALAIPAALFGYPLGVLTIVGLCWLLRQVAKWIVGDAGGVVCEPLAERVTPQV